MSGPDPYAPQSGDGGYRVEAYDLTIRTYPRSSSIPEAYYRKGVALRSLRQLDDARQAFEWEAVRRKAEKRAAARAGAQ